MSADPEGAPGAAGPGDGGGRARGAVPPSHALSVLELPRVLEVVARRATSEPGRRHVRGLRPHRERTAADEALRAADEMLGFLMREEEWAPGPIPDLEAAIRRLGVEGSVLEPAPLRQFAVLLASSRKARGELRRRADREDRPRMTALADALLEERELQERLERSFDQAGEVADAASDELGRIRRELRDRRSALVEKLESFARGLDGRIRVADASVTVRAGRYCIPVRREGRSSVGGIVHDESGSRQTLFVEPPLAIEPMNEIRELELAEAREVRRILRELTDALRPRSADLEATLRALVRLDSLYARGRYALGHGGTRPDLGGDGGRGAYRVVRGRHPLLIESDEDAVPFDLELAEDEAVLLVSGPNAGGKTVLLKSIGLLSALAQSGIVPPVGPGTRLPFFREFFAIIGDEQSIEASLSTFSATVRNLRRILAEADGGSLVLMDELGSHTDPSEGSALAAEVLLRLSRQVALTVATTHLGALKGLAGESERVVNASLQFDAEGLRPTFQLRRDRPGRSWALEIAGRLGLPEDLIERARSRLSREERALETVLGELEAREKELADRSRAAADRAREVEQRAERLAERERAVEGREREVERAARERSERYLLEARERVEETIRRLEQRYEASAAEDAGRGAGDGAAGGRSEVASEARSAVERAVREARERMPPEEPRPEEGRRVPPDLAEGDRVRIRSLDRTGEVQEVRDDRAVVLAGGVRLTLPAADLERAEPAGEGGRGGSGSRASRRGGAGGRPPAGASAAPDRIPEVEPRPEVDLRGLRVDEVEGALLPALDAAIVGDLPRLLVIHGKGTGALRERVRELLRTDPRVPAFRAGEHDEGGSGVTVAELHG